MTKKDIVAYKIAVNIQRAMSIIDKSGIVDYTLPLLYVALFDLFREYPSVFNRMLSEKLVDREDFQERDPLFKIEDY